MMTGLTPIPRPGVTRHRPRSPVCRPLGLAAMIASVAVLVGMLPAAADDETRPNILWVTSEDNGPHLGCYGDDYADTPHLDALAARSLRYHRHWSNAPVCAPARTTIISGMHATSLGGHHMRSGVRLPPEIKLYPRLLREAGYYCTNNSKTDYNFAEPDAGWHQSNRQAHWRGRPDEQTPFFAIFNFTVSHESQIRTRPHTPVHDPDAAPLPAYHPDTPEVRRDWAQYYDKVTEMDAQVGKVLAELEEDGLADSTIVFYYGDHGSGMPRSKRWPFDSGLRVPLIVHFPEKFRHLAPADYEPGAESSRLTSFVDLAPTVLSLAGIEPPSYMQGAAFAGPHEAEPKRYLFGYRGRMDERIDSVRTVTDGRYLYMRHFYPDRPYLKHVNYMFQTPTTRVWKRLFDEGKLNEPQAKFWQPKPVEELFDLQTDPDEVDNLAGQEGHAERVAAMRSVLRQWMVDTGDLGLMPEAEMHRRSGTRPPRDLIDRQELPLGRIADLAFSALDNATGPDVSRLVALTRDDDSVIRYWAVRGLDRRLRSGELSDAERRAASARLLVALDDESPSVGVAAGDGLLATGTASARQTAVARLLVLANLEKVGHLVPVAALNVLDIHWGRLDDDDRAAIRKLPSSEQGAPPRVGGYVARLLEYLADAE